MVLSHSGIFKDFGEVDLRCEVYSEAKTKGKCQKFAWPQQKIGGSGDRGRTRSLCLFLIIKFMGHMRVRDEKIIMTYDARLSQTCSQSIFDTGPEGPKLERYSADI